MARIIKKNFILFFIFLNTFHFLLDPSLWDSFFFSFFLNYEKGKKKKKKESRSEGIEPSTTRLRAVRSTD